MVQLLQNTHLQTEPAALKTRAKAFSALGCLPPDTDSFIALTRLGELAELAATAGQGTPMLDAVINELDCLAIGVTEQTVRDWERLMPLFQVLTVDNQPLLDSWGTRAEPAAARAIVAHQRDQQTLKGELLVQATRDFRMAPIYLVLTCKPGGERLMQQLSMLPLMLPFNSDGTVEMVGRGGWRGFCLRGDALDVSAANLAPEHEDQLRANMQKARLYLVTQAIGNKLVLVICSNLDEVKLAQRPAKSLLATDKLQPFDACMQEKPWLVGYSSPAVVDMQEKLNTMSGALSHFYCLGSVFKLLAAGDEKFAAPAAAADSLLRKAAELLPQKRQAEQLMVWQRNDAADPSLYILTESDACGLQYAPGELLHTACAALPETAFYLEGTPLTGGRAIDVPDLLREVDTVAQGYVDTLDPAKSAATEADVAEFRRLRPVLEKWAQSVSLLQKALTGSGAILLKETAVDAAQPLALTLKAHVACEPELDAAAAAWQDGLDLLRKEGGESSPCPVDVERQPGELSLCCGGNAFADSASASGVPVAGGSVFSLNLATLSRMAERYAAAGTDSRASDAAAAMKVLATFIDRVEGAATTCGDRLRILLRVQTVQK